MHHDKQRCVVGVLSNSDVLAAELVDHAVRELVRVSLCDAHHRVRLAEQAGDDTGDLVLRHCGQLTCAKWLKLEPVSLCVLLECGQRRNWRWRSEVQSGKFSTLHIGRRFGCSI